MDIDRFIFSTNAKPKVKKNSISGIGLSDKQFVENLAKNFGINLTPPPKNKKTVYKK
jgi:hypothetical protein